MNRRTLLGSAAAAPVAVPIPALAREKPLRSASSMSAPSAMAAGPISTISPSGRRKEYGDKVETTFIRSVPEGADAERA